MVEEELEKETKCVFIELISSIISEYKKEPHFIYKTLSSSNLC